jgi:hypothetical protein
MSLLRNPKDIEAVVQGFESCKTPADDFTHQEHLVVATWYLYGSTEGEALAKMKKGLCRFLNHHGVGLEKYNETITLFWLKMVRQVEAGLTTTASLTEVANAALEQLGNSKLIFDYYSEERAKSEEARTRWVEPDLKSLNR